MAVSNSQSDSDLGSDSSWSLLNVSNPPSKHNSFENLEDPESATKELVERQSETWKSDEGFQVLGSKSPKRNHQKSSRECINFLAIMGCLLTITGMTLLTTCLPSNYVESGDAEEFQNRLKEVYEHAQNPSFENAVNSIQSTKDAVDIAKSMNVFDSVMQNLKEEICEAFIPEIYNRTLASENLPELKTAVITPYYNEMLKAGKQLNSLSIGEQVENSTKSLLEGAKEMMKSTSLQVFVTTLMQDICLVKLISELSNRAKMSGKDGKKRKREASNDAKKPRKIDRKKRIRRSVLERIKNKNTLVMPAKSYTHGQLNLTTENGKSECERRFEELDSKWLVLGQNHRDTVQQIKDTFQKEINEIKEKEFVSLNRQQRIQFTRDKFIDTLKAHREAFLHSLRQLRDDRKEVMQEMCHNFKQFRDWGVKDLSMGNYTVMLPEGYDFVNTLKAIKNKERINLQATNNEAFSYISAKELQSNAREESPEETPLKRKNNFPERRTKSLKKKQVKKCIDEAKEGVQNITTLSEAKTKSLVLHQEEPGASSSQLAQEEEWLHDEAYEPISKKKEIKKDLNKLYDATFENQSKKIKKRDLIKWGKKLKLVPVDGLSKQDPSKTHRLKIARHGLH